MTAVQGTVVEHRLDAEGVDPLLLAGVNDANIQEVAGLFGIRLVLRGDDVILSGDPEAIERATPLVQHLLAAVLLKQLLRDRGRSCLGDLDEDEAVFARDDHVAQVHTWRERAGAELVTPRRVGSLSRCPMRTV